ncbi:MAG: signal peptidase I [Desulfobulbaceae bacterium]|nr:signal peptidase I [Desulfobulbaceae bacterium]
MTKTTSSPAPDQAASKNKSLFREYAESIIWALLLALIIRTGVVQAFKIPSGSMEDTLLIGDHLLVNKFIYGIKIPFTDQRILKVRDPQRGDIMVFEYPVNRSQDFIKRVIGVPGDEISERDKVVYVNGVPYRNPHEIHKDGLILPGETNPRDNFGPIKVPENSYFMMGDNRDNSYDSRFWGFVKTSDIKGKAFIKYWSWDSESWRVRWERLGRWIE